MRFIALFGLGLSHPSKPQFHTFDPTPNLLSNSNTHSTVKAHSLSAVTRAVGGATGAVCPGPPV